MGIIIYNLLFQFSVAKMENYKLCAVCEFFGFVATLLEGDDIS